MTRIDDLELVRRDYSNPSRLEERFRAWREYHTPDLLSIIRSYVASGPHGDILEVGCGDGRFSAELQRELGAHVMAMDLSPAMAAAAATRGLDVHIGDIQQMPWPDKTFDVVVANWMLYHVPDLSRALHEIHRVLRPGGRLIASTMGLLHMRELWDLIGDDGVAPALRFSRENGAEVLAEVFADVETVPLDGHATFPDREAAVRHVESTLTRSHLADHVPMFDGPLTVSTSNVMFIAHRL